MNKIKLSLVASTIILFTACGGGSSDAVTDAVTEPVSIDFTGTWNYKLTTQNTVCDGYTAEGTINISESASNTNYIGEIVIDGNTFDEDESGNCTLVSGSGNDDLTADNVAKTQTLDELFNLFDPDNNTSLSEDIEVSTYTNSKIEASYTDNDAETDAQSVIGVFTRL